MRSATQAQPVGLVIVTGFSLWAAWHFRPLMVGEEVQIVPVAAACLAVITGMNLLISILGFLVRVIDFASARSASGKEGTAQWGKYKDIKKELVKTHAGPFWGVLKDKPNTPVFSDFNSNAFVAGTSGSGKGHTAVVPMILSIPHSKVITDFKPELACICKQPLEKMGQGTVTLNPFGMHVDRLGQTYNLNPMDIVVDDLYSAGHLRDVLEDDREMNMQLYAEPANSKGDDKFWRDGSRDLISLAKLIECMMNGYHATLADVSKLIESRRVFADHLRMVAGLDLQGKPLPEGAFPFEQSDWAANHEPAELREFLSTIRGRAADTLALMLDDPKMFSSFAKGASQALASYAFGRLSTALGKTDFDFDVIKSGDRILNIIIIGDASRSEATEKFLGLMQWMMQLKLKRHPNKHVPVYQINDEANNYSVHGLISLLTWGRSFGIRTIQFFQNFSSYEEKHGKKAVDVLISESEIQLYLPAQRSPETIKKIVEILGRQSVMAARFAEDRFIGLREDRSEAPRPLATFDEVRRSPYGFLIIRQELPLLQIPVSYSAVNPWRKLADINPQYGKPFLSKVKLHLKIRDRSGRRRT